jgi:AcrR family transcriptional regulator
MRVSKNAYYYWFKNKDVAVLKTATEHLKERIRIILNRVERSMAAVGSKRN